MKKHIKMIKDFIFEEEDNSIYAKSFFESIKMNGFDINKEYDNQAISVFFSNNNEIKVDSAAITKNQGGIVVFSIDLNADNISQTEIIEKISNHIDSNFKKMYLDSKIKKVIEDIDYVYSIAIGNFVKGRYIHKKDIIFNDISLSIEVAGVQADILKLIALKLIKDFNQENALVKDYASKQITFIQNNDG